MIHKIILIRTMWCDCVIDGQIDNSGHLVVRDDPVVQVDRHRFSAEELAAMSLITVCPQHEDDLNTNPHIDLPAGQPS